ncbi:MAG: alpha-(1-_6)-mannopyranosyltransferase A, partial [Mycobacterium sp.]
AQSRSTVAAIAGFSTWIMVIFKPDGAHGMYSWLHVLVATSVALIAWHTLNRSPELVADAAEPA